MAYYDPTDDDEILNPNAPQPNQTGPQSGVISGQGSQPQAESSQAAPKTPDNPGNFVGIQQYLAQNKPQSAKLAEDVGTYVQGQGETAKSALSQGQSDFEKAVDESTVGFNEDLFKQAKENPQQVAADAAKKAEFQKMRDAQYKGPASLEDSDYYQPINMAIQNALGTADLTKSSEGRSQLLADIQKEKKERVSRGAANLDAALLSASPDSRTILQGARENIAPLQEQMKAVSEAENMKAQKAAQQTTAAQKAIQEAFSGDNSVQKQLEQGIRGRATQAQSQLGSETKAVIDALKRGDRNVSDRQLELLGIDRNQYLGLLNDRDYLASIGRLSSNNLNDLSQFATAQTPEALINPQNVATPEEYARYAALNDLMGTSYGFLTDPTQANKANYDSVDFNYSATPNAIADRTENISFRPQRDGLKPESFASLNKYLNLNSQTGLTGPVEAAKLAIGIAQDSKQYQDNPKNSVFKEFSTYRPSQLTSLNNALSDINKAYGTNIKLPQEYLDKALAAINSNLDSEYSKWKSPYKVMPNESQKMIAANLVAMTTFLSDLPRIFSETKGGIKLPPREIASPPPGKFYL